MFFYCCTSTSQSVSTFTFIKKLVCQRTRNFHWFITFSQKKKRVNPNSANAFDKRDASMKYLETNLLKKPSFRCRRGGKVGRPIETWTGNQIHIRCQDCKSILWPIGGYCLGKQQCHLLPQNLE